MTKRIIKAAKRQGWRVAVTSKGHIMLIPADKNQSLVVASGTPGDHRAEKNLLAQARRSGLVWPHR